MILLHFYYGARNRIFIFISSSDEYVKLAKIMIEYSQLLFNKIKEIYLYDIKDNIRNLLP